MAKKKSREPKLPPLIKADDYLRRHRKKISNALLIVALLLIFNFFTGLVSYGFTFARCLKPPVTATRFMAGYSFYLPGQQGYGPNMFSEYYCTADDARAAGFNPSVFYRNP